MIAEITGISVPIAFDPPAKGDVRDSVADITLAKKSIGYAPNWSIRKGLEATIEWFKKQESSVPMQLLGK